MGSPLADLLSKDAMELLLEQHSYAAKVHSGALLDCCTAPLMQFSILGELLCITA